MINDHKLHAGWYHFATDLNATISYAKDVAIKYADKSYDEKQDTLILGEYREEGSSFLPQGTINSAKALAYGYNANLDPMPVPEGLGQSGSQAFNSVEYDVTGTFVDVGMYLSGEPECMASPAYSDQDRRISLCIAANASYNVKAKDLQDIGRQVSALLRGLDDQGYQTSLDVISVVEDGMSNRNESILISIKEFEDPFDGDLIDWLFTPMFFRWGKFAATDLVGAASRGKDVPGTIKPFRSRGCPLQVEDHIGYLAPIYGKQYDIVLPSLTDPNKKQKVIDAIQAFRPK